MEPKLARLLSSFDKVLSAREKGTDAGLMTWTSNADRPAWA
jgi:hypothetical protein